MKKIFLLSLIIFLMPIVNAQVTNDDVIFHYSMDGITTDTRIYNSKAFNLQPHLDYSPQSMLSPFSMGAYGSNRALMLNNASYTASTNMGLMQAGVNNNEYTLRFHVWGYDGFGNDIGTFLDFYEYDPDNPSVKNINRIRVLDQSGFPSGGVVQVTNSTGHIVYNSHGDFVIPISEAGNSLFFYFNENEIRVYSGSSLIGTGNLTGTGFQLGGNHRLELLTKTVPVDSRIDEITLFNRDLSAGEKTFVMSPEENWLLETYDIQFFEVVPYGLPLIKGDTISNRQLATFNYDFVNPAQTGNYKLEFSGDLNVYDENLQSIITNKNLNITGTQSGEFSIGLGTPDVNYTSNIATLQVDLKYPDNNLVTEYFFFFPVDDEENLFPEILIFLQTIPSPPLIPNYNHSLNMELILSNIEGGNYEVRFIGSEDITFMYPNLTTLSGPLGNQQDTILIFSDMENVFIPYAMRINENYTSEQISFIVEIKHINYPSVNELFSKSFTYNIQTTPDITFFADNFSPDIPLKVGISHNFDLFTTFKLLEAGNYTGVISGNVEIYEAGTNNKIEIINFGFLEGTSVDIRNFDMKLKDLVNPARLTIDFRRNDNFFKRVNYDIPSDIEEGVAPPISGETPDWFPSPPDGQKPFYALLIIFIIGAFVSLSTPTESLLARASFGAVTVIGMFLLFSYIGWIPMWITVMLLIITVLIIAGLVGRVIIGGR